jgi:hypothetical protein
MQVPATNDQSENPEIDASFEEKDFVDHNDIMDGAKSKKTATTNKDAADAAKSAASKKKRKAERMKKTF